MDTTGRFILWLFLAPDDWVSDRLGVTADQIRDLMRMLVDSLFSIVVAVIGPAIWTSGLPMYQQTGADLPVNSRPLFQLELMVSHHSSHSMGSNSLTQIRILEITSVPGSSTCLTSFPLTVISCHSIPPVVVSAGT